MRLQDAVRAKSVGCQRGEEREEGGVADGGEPEGEVGCRCVEEMGASLASSCELMA